MNCLLISYDLGVPESSADYQNVINYIENLGSSAKPLYSIFLVLTNKTASIVVDELLELTDSNDRILVVNVTGDGWASAGLNNKVTLWMNKNM